LPEFVVPVSQPTDSSHFHSINDALGVLSQGVLPGTRLQITIEPGASPDPAGVSLTVGTPTASPGVDVTIQGDPNVPASILPSEQIQVTGSGCVLTNLNLTSLILGSSASPGDPGTSGNLISKCSIQDLQEYGIRDTFTQNMITGHASFQGDAPTESLPSDANDDLVMNNTFTSNALATARQGIVTVSSCDGISISQNAFYGDDPDAIFMLNSGQPGYFATVANNTFTLNSGTAVFIREEGTGVAGVNVLNNRISAGGGLLLSCTDGSNFSAVVQGNDFSGAYNAVVIVGDGSSCGTIDLGGGSNPGFNSSLGGNDFRGRPSLARNAEAIYIGEASSSTVTAHHNLFLSGANPRVFVGQGGGTIDLGSNQLSQTQAFVQGLYDDLLGRTGSLAELNLWVNVYNSQGQAAVANGIVRSSEALGRVVDSFYLRFLGRQSDSAGRAAWINLLQHGASLESVEAGFITSPEYLSHIDTDFVQSLYINLLGRTGSAAELALWNNSIQTLGLAGIASAFLTSQEYRGDNVAADFQLFLHRSPSPAETSAFVGMSADLLGIEAAILSSQECFSNI
jgi:hypothetical protein